MQWFHEERRDRMYPTDDTAFNGIGETRMVIHDIWFDINSL